MVNRLAQKLVLGKYWLMLLVLAVSFLIVAIPQKAAAAGEIYLWQTSTVNGQTTNQIVGNGGEFDKFEPKVVTFNQEGTGVTYRNNSVASRIPGCGSAAQPRYLITVTGSATATIVTESQGCASSPVLSGTIALSGAAPGGSLGGPQPVTLDDDWCTSGDDASELKYFMCPVIEVAAGFIEKVDCQILSFIKLDTVTIFHTGGVAKGPVCGLQDTDNQPTAATEQSSTAYRAIWSAFRTVALAILVILGLIMIASQILGLEIFDAYTIRKMLPKLIIATIFMSLSWEIMQFLYNAANASADAVLAILKLPFKGFTDIAPNQSIEDTLLQLPVTVLIFQLSATAIGAGLAVLIGVLGIGGVLAAIASFAIAAFSVVILLIARDIVATLLVVFAPIAIICSAYQPFEKVFSFWKTFLVALLISIPAVALILGISQAAALVALLSE